MIEEKITNIVGRLDYRKGKNLLNNVELGKKVSSNPLEIYEFYVISERFLNKYYSVNIIVKNG